MRLERKTLRVVWDPVLSRWANLCRAYGAEFIVAFPIRCVSIWQEIYRDCVAVKRKERGCDGRQALGIEAYCYWGAG
jgi:hypothetical protein